MKLQSFALQSKSNSKPKPSKNFANDSSSSQFESSKNPEFVSEFDPSRNPNSAPKKAIIIPPKENEWRPHKKMKNLELPPLHSGNKPLDFELEDADIVAANDSGASMSFGLNLRQNNGKVDDFKSSSSSNGSSSIDAIMIKQFKSDLENLPEEQGFDEYDDMPVDGFGAALLAGYGWREGRGIGKNARDDVKVVEYKRRTAKEGLGFMADHPPPPPPPPPVSTNATAADKGKENAGRSNGKSDVFGVGKEVRVVSGEMIGLKGRVVEVLGGGLVVLDGEVLGRETVRVDEIAGLGSVEEEKCLRKLKELKIRESRDDRRNDEKKGKDKDDKSSKKEGKRSRDHAVDRGIKSEGVRREEKKSSSSNVKRVMWLQSNIRVRVISKEIKGGKFYLKKGVVVDVIGPGICDVAMDDGREVIRAVDQDVLETALPKRGGPVLVLFGKRKGVYGKLVEKDSEKETGVIQDGDTLEMFNVKLEEIAEYLGDPSLLGIDNWVVFSGNCCFCFELWTNYMVQKDIGTCISCPLQSTSTSSIRLSVTGLPRKLHILGKCAGRLFNYCRFVFGYMGHLQGKASSYGDRFSHYSII